jgi:hypothetical protein
MNSESLEKVVQVCIKTSTLNKVGREATKGLERGD